MAGPSLPKLRPWAMSETTDRWLQQWLTQLARFLRLLAWWPEGQGLRCYARRVNRAADRAPKRATS